MYILPGNSAFANLYKEGIIDLKANILRRVIPSEVYFGASSFPKGSYFPYSPIFLFALR